MDMENVTNGMLYDLIRDFKDDVNRRFVEVDRRFEQITAEMNSRFEQVDKRFEQITAEMNLRFEQVDKHFEQVHREMGDMKEMIKEDRKKLNDVYESRDKVTVTFSRAFVGINMVLSAMVSAVVSFVVSK